MNGNVSISFMVSRESVEQSNALLSEAEGFNQRFRFLRRHYGKTPRPEGLRGY
jgi:hypothetical protein